VTPMIVSEDELKLLLKADIRQDKEPAAKVRLTMKYLYQLIDEIQQDKQKLTMRVYELEQQLYELYQIRDEAAAASELAISGQSNLKSKTEIEDISDIPEVIQIKRSERHALPKKKNSFGRLWFHRRTT
jgi:transcriptional regulator of heat shock response